MFYGKIHRLRKTSTIDADIAEREIMKQVLHIPNELRLQGIETAALLAGQEKLQQAVH